MAPFYNTYECIKRQKAIVAKLNHGMDEWYSICNNTTPNCCTVDITVLPTRGPVSQYQIIDPESGETLSGKLEIELGDPMIVRIECPVLMVIWVRWSTITQ